MKSAAEVVRTVAATVSKTGMIARVRFRSGSLGWRDAGVAGSGIEAPKGVGDAGFTWCLVVA